MKKELFINGRGKEGENFSELRSPYSGELLALVPQATPAQVNEAIDAAFAAAHVMAALPAHRRSAILEGVAKLLEERKDEAAMLIAKEAGKPLKIARGEVTRTIETYRFSAEEAKRIGGEVLPLDASASGEKRLAYTVREPLGVIGAITPFNFPMNLVAHKVGPALASGNTVVLKPAGQTPLSALFIAELFREAGLPAGALNVLTGKGSEIGKVLIADERVRMITFTGSPAVGMNIKQQAGLKRTTLELGSNSALIIDKVSDPDKVARRAVTGAFSFQGQVCISVQRIYVVKESYETFLSSFIAATKELKSGDPLIEDTDISVLITPGDTNRILEWIDEAVKDGAGLAFGGKVENGILLPTILTGVKREQKICCMEAFGPVVFINRVDDVETAVRMVNDSRYGLQAGIYTDNLHTALWAAEKLQVGGVMINDIPTFRVDHMPYGGVKESGMGREGVKYAIEEMTELKLVVFNRN